MLVLCDLGMAVQHSFGGVPKFPFTAPDTTHRLALGLPCWPQRAGSYLKLAWLQQTLHADPQPTKKLHALLQGDPLFSEPGKWYSQPAAAGATGTTTTTTTTTSSMDTEAALDVAHAHGSGTEAASSTGSVVRGGAERQQGASAGAPGGLWVPRLQLQLLGLTAEALRGATALVQPSAGGSGAGLGMRGSGTEAASSAGAAAPVQPYGGGVSGPGAGPVQARGASATESSPLEVGPAGATQSLQFPPEMDGLLAAIDARLPPAASPESFYKNKAARYLLWVGQRGPPHPYVMSDLGASVPYGWVPSGAVGNPIVYDMEAMGCTSKQHRVEPVRVAYRRAPGAA